MKKRIRVVLLICLLLILCLLIGYFLLAYYYRQGFALNTWINGVYCTGKSVEEVNAELLSRVEAPIVIITDNKGEQYEINLADAGYQADYLVSLQNFRKEQNPYLWIDNVTFHANHKIAPLVHYDTGILKGLFEKLPFVKKEEEESMDYLIVRDQTKGYQLYDGSKNRLDAEKAFSAFLSVVESGGNYLDLQAADCYYDIPLSEKQEELAALWEKIEAFQSCNLVYDMGDEKLEFTPDIMSSFLLTEEELPVVDEQGSLVLDEKAVEAFIGGLAEKYDTYGKERKFMSTRGEEITLQKGTYGTTINQKAEIAYLMENLLLPKMHSGTGKEHIPEYTREAFVRGRDDIGGTYIEVDMTQQKLYYYLDYELKIETDVVTGNVRRKMETPEGIYYVYNKQTDRILRGPGYASPVDYWMPVKGSIGIHDASWRKEFGGEIYRKNGSHGCINLPTDIMPELYEMVEIGTPAILFY